MIPRRYLIALQRVFNEDLKNLVGITEKPDPGPVGPALTDRTPAEYPFISMFPGD